MADTSKVSTFKRSGTAETGKEQTFTITRKDTSYTHTLVFDFGTITQYIATKVNDTTIKWTPAIENIAPDMPNSASGTGKFRLITYTSSGTKVGEVIEYFTFSLPETVVPTISSVTLTEAEDIIKALSLPTETFVNTLSKINYKIEADGTYGSTIKSYSIKLGGVVYSGSEGTTEVINERPQLYEIEATATDSRGRTGTKKITYRVLEYSPPQIIDLVAYRDENDEAKIHVGFSAFISELNQENRYSILLSYKVLGDDDFETIYQYSSPVDDPETAKVEKETVFSWLKSYAVTPTNSTDNTYQVELVISDKFSTVSRIAEVPSGTPVFDIYGDGSGMGFAQVSKPNEYGFRKPVAFYGGWKAKEIEATKEKPYNIDTILQAGIYHCSDTTYLTNKPYNQTANITASLMVLECGNAGQLAQIYTVCTKDGNLEYRRFRFYDTWGEWYRTSGEVVLWQTADNSVNGDYGTGGWYMQASQTIKLSEKISKQPNGIKLVFCRYYNNQVVDQQMQTFTVSKTEVAITGKMGTYENGNPRATGAGHTFLLTSAANFTLMAAKYLYIADEYITGNDNNKTGETVGACGVTYTNNAYVLRLVIGY